ncbi:MAG: hypothetical protein ABF657_06790 [Lentilactobacillus diolivorans]|uniref:hypothetical protein n=1 Tax=Lentilactobacillus diolivorans TaxID=179838 RepID=UPI0039E97367
MRAYLSHFTQRNMFFVSMIFLLTFLIAGCSQTNRGHDRVVVYNAAHKRVTVITGKRNLKQFLNIAGDAGTKDTKLTRKLPQTAKVKYYYVIPVVLVEKEQLKYLNCQIKCNTTLKNIS